MSAYVFVGHRFTAQYMDDLREALESALAEGGDTRAEYADLHLVQGHILSDKINPLIDGSLFCIFDISEVGSPNVFIELGYAYGRGKYVILTSKNERPSDLAGYDVILYESFKDLRKKLSQFLPQITRALLEARRPKFAREQTIRELFNKLDEQEKAVLREVVCVGRSRGDLNSEEKKALHSVEAKTGFVSCTFVGSYEVNEPARPILEAIFASGDGLDSD